ncbi:MAG: hypothetical protein Fur002_21330 [Anaerolineales bacterium]
MELKQYAAIAKRWAWLIVTSLALGALLGVIASALETPAYKASTQIMVLRAPQEQANDYTYLSDQQLVQTYMQLLKTQPVLDKTSTILGDAVRSSQISVNQISDTQTVIVEVEDTNAQHAAAIANALVQALVEQNEIIQTSRYAQTEQSLHAQIAQIEAQINAMNSEIDNVSAEKVIEQQKQVGEQIAMLQNEAAQLQGEISALKTEASQQALLAEKEARLNQVLPVLELYQQIYTDLVVLGKPVTSGNDNSRLSQLQTTMQLYQQIYINLLNNLESIRLAKLQNTPNVVQIEAAFPPSKPVRPTPLTTIPLAGFTGMVIAAAVAFLLEYTDDTIRSPEDVERILNLPILGYISQIQLKESESPDGYVFYHPRSPVAEAFRALRTNLEYSNVDSPLRNILITSAGPSEGKTMVAVNLAIIMAQSGKRVLLIDADMRRPRIHRIFGVSNQIGLSALFRKNAPTHSVVRPVEGINNLFLMTSGNPPPNPAELLDSAKMTRILEECGQIADVVIVDSPPSLVTDYQVLARKMDGTLLVIEPEETHAESAYAMLEQLRRVNARVLGVTMNKIKHGAYYHGPQYYYRKDKYYVEDAGSASPKLPSGEAVEPMVFYKADVPSATNEPAYAALPSPRGNYETSSYIIQEQEIEYWYDHVSGD